MEKLGSLKTEVAKINLPYRRDYNFNNDLNLEDDIKGRLKDKRRPDFEEMNLDVNNLDIQVMADEVSKYRKGFQNKENALNFDPNFYGIKDKKKMELNTKFFPGETDKRNIATSKSANLTDESERLGKMKETLNKLNVQKSKALKEIEDLLSNKESIEEMYNTKINNIINSS